MEIIKEFAVTLVSTLVLITAVEIILPDNSMKKYSKFILGAMLIGVILNPILKFFTNGEETISKKIMSYDIDKVEKSEEKDTREKIRLESFKDNLSRNINNILKNEFNEYEFSNEIDCVVNFKTMDIDIKNVMVTVKETKNKKIKKVEKVEITKEKKQEVKTDKKFEKIREFLAKELKLEKEKIKVIQEEED